MDSVYFKSWKQKYFWRCAQSASNHPSFESIHKYLFLIANDKFCERGKLKIKIYNKNLNGVLLPGFSVTCRRCNFIQILFPKRKGSFPLSAKVCSKMLTSYTFHHSKLTISRILDLLDGGFSSRYYPIPFEDFFNITEQLLNWWWVTYGMIKIYIFIKIGE